MDREEGEVIRPPDRFPAPVNLDQVVDKLEGEETDGERRRDGMQGVQLPLQQGAGPGKQAAEQVHTEKLGVLVEAQGSDTECDGGGAEETPARQSGQIGDQSDDDDREHAGRPGKMKMEDRATGEQPEPAQDRQEQEPIDREEDCAEADEPVGVENHATARVVRC